MSFYTTAGGQILPTNITPDPAAIQIDDTEETTAETGTLTEAGLTNAEVTAAVPTPETIAQNPEAV